MKHTPNKKTEIIGQKNPKNRIKADVLKRDFLRSENSYYNCPFMLDKLDVLFYYYCKLIYICMKLKKWCTYWISPEPSYPSRLSDQRCAKVPRARAQGCLLFVFFYIGSGTIVGDYSLRSTWYRTVQEQRTVRTHDGQTGTRPEPESVHRVDTCTSTCTAHTQKSDVIKTC